MSDWLNPVDGGSGGVLTYPLTDQQMRYDDVRHRYVFSPPFLSLYHTSASKSRRSLVF